MAEEEQQLKKAAALAYDYEGHPQWSAFLSNVHVPDNRSQSEVERFLKFKFYQRNVDPDLKVEKLASKPSGIFPSTSNTAPQRSNRQEERSRASQDTTYSARQRNGNIRSMTMDHHSVGFLLNSLVIIMGILTTLPFLPPTIGGKSYRFTFLGALIACGHAIHAQYGRPRVLNLQGIQAWMQSAIAGKDFLYFLYSIIFITTLYPIKFAVVPVIYQSLLSVAQSLKRNFSNASLYRKYLEKPCKWLESNTTIIRTLSANCEIGIGFLLLILLLAPQKNFIQLLAYWQLLRLMYHAPTSAYFHRAIWAKIGTKLNPIIHRYTPFFETPLQYAKRWFQN